MIFPLKVLKVEIFCLIHRGKFNPLSSKLSSTPYRNPTQSAAIPLTISLFFGPTWPNTTYEPGYQNLVITANTKFLKPTAASLFFPSDRY